MYHSLQWWICMDYCLYILRLGSNSTIPYPSYLSLLCSLSDPRRPGSFLWHRTVMTFLLLCWWTFVAIVWWHVAQVHESVDPYVKTVRAKSKPYVDHATKILSPHLEKAGPYVKIANDHYQNVVSQATTYHEQLQDSVKGTMGKHEVLARWATKELIWFLASALLALPVVASLLVFSSVFGSKTPNQAKPQRRTASPSSSSQSNTATKKPRKPRTTSTTTTTEAKQHPAKWAGKQFVALEKDMYDCWVVGITDRKPSH